MLNVTHLMVMISEASCDLLVGDENIMLHVTHLTVMISEVACDSLDSDDI